MCGIVAIIGQTEIQENLLKGLERLEYRGYDSAGIYVVDEAKQGNLWKEAGRIAKLREEVDTNVSAHIGIGHTRWATHGEANTSNAHPHQSQNGRFTLVHNGVIENYKEIRDEYLTDYNFKSETDTEIIVGMIEYFANEGASTYEAFKKALSLLHGSYAIALIDNQDADTLYAAKNKSPLLIGRGEGYNVIASDAMATINLTNQYIEIHDGEVIRLTEEAITIETLAGDSVTRDAYIAEIDESEIDKGSYPHYMIKEIDEQPIMMRRLVQTYQEEGIDESLVELMQQADRLYIVACGTSYNAGLIGKNYFEQWANIPTEVHLASEFAYHVPLLSERPFFIFLTQSGETADSRQALVAVNKLGYPSLTITNVKGSTLSREAQFTLLLYAGPEIAVASTKAYTGQAAVMAILAAKIGQTEIDIFHELSLIASVMESIISSKDKIKAWSDENLLETRSAFYLGRFMDYYVAMEAALKLKEITYTQTEAFAAGELKHGSIALIEEGVPVIAIISDPKTAPNTRSNIEEVKARGADVAVIAMDNLSQEGDEFVISTVDDMLTPLVTVVVTQLIAYYTSLGRGLDVDKPRNLAKSVTVE